MGILDPPSLNRSQGDTLYSKNRTFPIELMPVFIIGHSWGTGTGGQTVGARWFDRIKSRLGLGTITNKSVAGRTIGDLSNLTIQSPVTSTYGWQTYSKYFVFSIATINDLTIFQGSSAARLGYNYAWKAMLATLTAVGLKASNTSQWTFDSNFTQENILGATSNTQGQTIGSTGGLRWTSTVIGSYATTTVRGTAVDLFFVARSAGAGVITITLDGTTYGTFDLTQPVAQDCIAVYSMRNMSNSDHTIIMTLTSGSSITVDSYRIPHQYPVPGVILGEPPIIPANTDYANYLNDLKTYKSDLASIVAQYPSFTFIDLDTPQWDQASMLGPDGTHTSPGTGQKHPSDKGSSYITDMIQKAIFNNQWYAGLNIVASDLTVPYTAPAVPAIPSGGHAGNYLPAARATGAIGSYRAASLVGTDGTIVTTWAEFNGGTALGASTGGTIRTSPIRYLQLPINTDFNRALTGCTNRFIVFQVPVLPTIGTRLPIMGSSLSSGTGRQYLYIEETGHWALENGTTPLVSSVLATTGWHLAFVSDAGTSSVIRIDNQNADIGDSGSTNAGGNLKLAQDGNYSGNVHSAINVAEVDLYGSLTQAQIDATMQAILSDYSTVIS